jgi:hypothetical protein
MRRLDASNRVSNQSTESILPIQSDLIASIFIGGSTEWKLSFHAQTVIKAAQALGKWVHAARVNTPVRYEYFESLDVDLIDGTGLSRYSWMRERIYQARIKLGLFKEAPDDRSLRIVSFVSETSATRLAEASPKFLPARRHRTGKEGTSRIERHNLNFRTRLKRLQRHTICYSKSAAMRDAVIKLHAHHSTAGHHHF